MEKYEIILNGSWQLCGRKESDNSVATCKFETNDLEVLAEVPGNIEDSLHHAGYVSDPYSGMNAKQLRSYEFHEWIYSKTFSYDGNQRDLKLCVEGIDCIATIFINGIMVGSCSNALIPHCFPIEQALKAGENSIAVHIASANMVCENHTLNVSGFSSYPFNYESIRIRRPAHSWGWDIAPRMALGGIFPNISIEEIPEHYIKEDFLQTLEISDTSASMGYSYHIATPALREKDLRITLDGQCRNSKFHAESAVWSVQGFIRFNIDDPLLWWPRNYGDADIYKVTVRLWAGDNELLCKKNLNVGIRTIELHAEPIWTEASTPDFQFIVNGHPVRTFGTNHVPLDALHSHDRDHLDDLLEMAVDLNCNIIRIWGGGIYELPEFYDYCDKAGILVWQDFMMGCAVYPNDREFCDIIRHEAKTAVRMLRHHPSLALWAGDNECDLAYFWGWGGKLDPNGNCLTREVLPQVCKENDPMRPYLPSSPWVSPLALSKSQEGEHEADWYSSEQHLWGPRDYFKSDFYRNTHASFLSETGYHGSPNASAIQRFIPQDFWWPMKNNQQWYYHASNPFLPDSSSYNFRIDIMDDQIQEFFGFSPQSLETFACASQICQAEAVKYLIELFRSRSKCSGMIWWNLRDCWPQFSDAIVDYYGGKKLAYHIIKRIQNPVLVMLSEADAWTRKVIVVNDSRKQISGSYLIRDAEDNSIYAEGSFQAEAGQIIEIESMKVITTVKQLFLIEWKLDDGTTGCNHTVTGYPQFDFELFSKSWLPAIAGLDDSFSAESVGL